MIDDVLDDGPALRRREPVEAMPHAGAANAHAPIDARYVRTTDEHGHARRARLEGLAGVVDR